MTWEMIDLSDQLVLLVLTETWAVLFAEDALRLASFVHQITEYQFCVGH